MVQDTRQEVAEAIKERTGADVADRLHEECLARYEALDPEERRLLIEQASEYILACKELAECSEETRAEAREKLETVRKLLLSPHLVAVTSEFSHEAGMLHRIAFPEEYANECPVKFRVGDSSPEGADRG